MSRAAPSATPRRRIAAAHVAWRAHRIAPRRGEADHAWYPSRIGSDVQHGIACSAQVENVVPAFEHLCFIHVYELERQMS